MIEVKNMIRVPSRYICLAATLSLVLGGSESVGQAPAYQQSKRGTEKPTSTPYAAILSPTNRSPDGGAVNKVANEINSDAARIKQLANDILDKTQMFIGPQSPLKIKGGAMTFRSSSEYGVDANNNPCLIAANGFGKIVLYDVFDVLLRQRNDVATIANSGPRWQIDFYGRKSDGSISDNGIRIRTTDSCSVAGGPRSSGLVLLPEPNSHSGFYRNTAELDPDLDTDTFQRRFRDKTFDSSSPSESSDEDVCEKIHTIFLNTSNKTTKGEVRANPFGKYRCIKGECSISLGTP